MAEAPKRRPRGSDTFTQSLARGLTVIRAFGWDRPELRLTEVAQYSGLSAAVARRVLLTLTELGYASAHGRYFRLTPKILELGGSFLDSCAVVRVARPIVRENTLDYGLTCIGVLDGDEMVVVDVVAPRSRTPIASHRIGTRVPAFRSAIGHVLLGGLSNAQLDFAIDRAAARTGEIVKTNERRQIHERTRLDAANRWACVETPLIEVASVAVPLFDRAGTVVAAAGICERTARMSMKALLAQALPRLTAIGQRVGEAVRATSHQ